MSETKFEFDLKDEVLINASGEQGEIIGRADYVHDQNNYYVVYKAGDGRAVKAWWGEDEIQLQHDQNK